jgi:hypothetical protein
VNICTPGNCICDAREWEGDTDCFGNTTEDDLHPQPAASPPRTTASSATYKQRAFVDRLLFERDVPRTLRNNIKCAAPMTDGDARRFIPLLLACEERNDDDYDAGYGCTADADHMYWDEQF